MTSRTPPIEQDIAKVVSAMSREQRGAWDCQVVRGEPSWVSDDSRVSINQFVPDPGEPQHITIGVFLGKHSWGMATLTPEQAVLVAAMILDKPAVRQFLQDQST